MPLPKKTRKPTDEEREEAAWYDAFGEPGRLRVLRALAAGDKTLQELAEECGILHQNIFAIVNRLERIGHIVTRRDGLYRRCSLAPGVKVKKNAIEFIHPSGCKAVVPLS